MQFLVVTTLTIHQVWKHIKRTTSKGPKLMMQQTFTHWFSTVITEAINIRYFIKQSKQSWWRYLCFCIIRYICRTLPNWHCTKYNRHQASASCTVFWLLMFSTEISDLTYEHRYENAIKYSQKFISLEIKTIRRCCKTLGTLVIWNYYLSIKISRSYWFASSLDNTTS